PKVIILIVTCLDDLIGTDHEALKEDLTARFPGIVFQSSHMNPIKTDTTEPPAQAIQRDIYRTIATDFDNRGIDPNSVAHDECLNLLGVYEHLPQSCELHKIAPLRHVDEYAEFSAFTQMAASRYSLLLAPLGTLAAKELEQDFGIPYLYLPVSYDLEVIGEAYASLATVLGYENGFDFSEEKNRALRAIQEAKAALGDMPILVDSSATYHPFGLAKALLSYGFHVVRVEAEFVLAEEQPAIDWISTHFPDVECFRPDSYRAVLFDHRLPESLAIGIQSAYMASSKYIVDLFADLQMFGYDGVCRLMQLMIEAIAQPRDLKKLIDEYGLVV
nr:nitrogenase component 1 [Lachnospiraceae bacterium]